MVNFGLSQSVSCTFQEKKGQIVSDQLGTIDKTRLVKKHGAISSKEQSEGISVLQRLFAF